MGRQNSIEMLQPEQFELAKQCIRSHRYMILDAILADMRELGIQGVSRSTLGRYVPTLKAQDEMKAAPGEETVITIVERSSGEVRVIRTGVSAASVAAQIMKLQAALALS